MKNLISSGGSRRLMAAVVMGTALSAMAGEAIARPQPATEAVNDISRYCQVCWRNARLHPDSWQDCTQEVLIRLLQSVDAEKWPELLKQESDDRREFFRAIDAVKKRSQRSKKYHVLADDLPERRPSGDSTRNELEEELDLAAGKVLTQRQQQILRLTRDGWSVPEIADELKTTVERVSDEKYKAIQKLRKEMNG